MPTPIPPFATRLRGDTLGTPHRPNESLTFGHKAAKRFSIHRLSTIGGDFFGGGSHAFIEAAQGIIFPGILSAVDKTPFYPACSPLSCGFLRGAEYRAGGGSAAGYRQSDRLGNRYLPNASYWAAWCGIVRKGVWSSRGHGLSSCTNTSPVTAQNMVARVRHFASYMERAGSCETRAT